MITPVVALTGSRGKDATDLTILALQTLVRPVGFAESKATIFCAPAQPQEKENIANKKEEMPATEILAETEVRVDKARMVPVSFACVARGTEEIIAKRWRTLAGRTRVCTEDFAFPLNRDTDAVAPRQDTVAIAKKLRTDSMSCLI